MRRPKALSVLALALCSVGLRASTTSGGALGYGPYPADPVPMRLQLDFDGQRYLVGENFPIIVRIINPNTYSVYLEGFEFGRLEPHIAMAFPEGIVFPGEEEFFDISLGGMISAMGGPPVLVPARGDLQHRRLVYIGTKLDMGHWVLMPPGTYRVQVKSHVSAVTLDEPRRYTKVDWTSEVLAFTLTMPTGRDAAALEFLRQKANELAEHERTPEPGFRRVRFELSVYPQFLERFPDTIYAPEIRWRVAKLLDDELGNDRIAEQDVPQMLELWEQSLTFCLERGGAYAEEFVHLRKDEPTNHQMELAERLRRFDLLKRIITAIDRRYPDDEAGILFRRAIVAGHTESPGEARKILQSLVERFPDDPHAKNAGNMIESIDRGRWPAEPPDEETVMYRAAAKAAQWQSREEAHKTVQAVLDRFPNGRYASPIRALLEAIDNGTWPPKLPQGPTSDEP